jgi:acyl-ACP thioesterase
VTILIGTTRVVRELGGSADHCCTKCSGAFATKRVVVEGGQSVVIEGRPFWVGIDAEFLMCVRCRSVYLEPMVTAGR